MNISATSDINNAMDEDRSSGGRRVARHVAWWVGIIAGLAGIAGLVYSIISAPNFTVKDWAKEANAVCDAHFGEVIENIRLANEAVDKANTKTATASDYRVAASAWVKLGASERRLSGELGKLKTPSSRGDTIRKLIEAMNDVSIEDFRLADDLRVRAVSNESWAGFNTRRNQAVALVNAHLTTLKTTHCLGE